MGICSAATSYCALASLKMRSSSMKNTCVWSLRANSPRKRERLWQELKRPLTEEKNNQVVIRKQERDKQILHQSLLTSPASSNVALRRKIVLLYLSSGQNRR